MRILLLFIFLVTACTPIQKSTTQIKPYSLKDDINHSIIYDVYQGDTLNKHVYLIK